jgi:hypothetical protein
MPLSTVGLIHAKKMFCMQCDNAVQTEKARNKNAIILSFHLQIKERN